MRIMRLAAAFACLAVAQPASASVYSDDLAKCLVAQTSDADKSLLMQWVFAAMAANPAVKSLSAVTPAQASDITRRSAGLFVRLLTKDCRSQSVAALKYDGPTSLEASFAILGQVAMRGMMADPAAAGILGELGAALDQEQLRSLFTEAGLQVPAEAAAPAGK